jgi:hypothetical protein
MSIFPTASSEVASDQWKYRGIGGWLILITIGLCIAPLLQLAALFTNHLPIFTNGSWALLTQPGAPAYHPLWAPTILLELAMNVGFLAMEAVLLVWLFKKSSRFPKAMIAYLLIVFVLVALDYFLANAIPAVAEQNDAAGRRSFMRAGIACAIWIPYFLRSKRVNLTFVN